MTAILNEPKIIFSLDMFHSKTNQNELIAFEELAIF